ncbi:MAG: class I SAM-dependent rRNA methyltransferase [Candidatus Rokubacteria bacterium]|nr:class I SAM-dependent rRNA methyltransferase [Candidatus Rokubacteria bacterium]
MLRLKRGHDRPRSHPWIFKGDVADVSDVVPGTVVTVLDSAARFAGRGIFNPKPALCCRILTRVDEPLDRAFYLRRIGEAIARRRRSPVLAGAIRDPRIASRRAAETATGDAGAERIVWSEADGLPGLVVDRYGAVLVVQCLTLGMAEARAVIIDAVRSHLGTLPVFASDDPTAAALEGFQPVRGWIGAAGPERLTVHEGRVRLQVTLGGGHKTGLYLDQAENRRRIGSIAAGRAMLDAFSYTAGFACHALGGGATAALCIESGPDALAGARANLAMNGIADRAEVRAGNVFDELRSLERDRRRFGVVVLDPPPFARSRGALEAAARGYKEINLRAMRLLEPGGVLATFSCSHHVSDALFAEVCREAAVDAGVTLRVLETLTQAADHPVLLTVPETKYLKGLLLEAL